MTLPNPYPSATKIFEPMDWNNLSHEYGLDGKRLLPWGNTIFPFGGAYCVIRAGTVSLDHVNEPAGEEELFICLRGQADVIVGSDTVQAKEGDVIYIPANVKHFIRNNHASDFHIYSVWWDRTSAKRYIDACQECDI